MQSFHQFMMRYRGIKQDTKEKRLAEWMYHDHDFPKHSTDYDEISRYLEWNVPFNEAIQTFDDLWEEYQQSII
ncbi:Uncharacterized protein YozE, UPF0346 family [Pelagirhabdus alkalitolerans]|uniref:Uncharacterized protein YozE, UPF0346 family n=1 Tax=Pelagirhabdus alkalitolerans TaxID=1612202 RepID=A0A1G6H9E3_9BACI|nr:YozE family protein [Pelagirhabdus alkalitolerans]SDB90821.1 Uncharacterized protein YozE, UPF0346 family [Pelagirhabdus alkalitolerans]